MGNVETRILTPDARLATFRDNRGVAVTQWPKQLLPSATVIIVDQTIVLHEDWRTTPWRVVIQQRADNHWWAFPGGRQEVGESIQECAIRECEEETGYRVELDCLTSVDSDPCHGAIVDYADGPIQYTNLTFLAHVVSGTLHVSDESKQVCWAHINALPVPWLPTHGWRLQMALARFSPIPVF